VNNSSIDTDPDAGATIPEGEEGPAFSRPAALARPARAKTPVRQRSLGAPSQGTLVRALCILVVSREGVEVDPELRTWALAQLLKETDTDVF